MPNLYLERLIALDLATFRRKRGLNALGTLVTSGAELVFAALSIWYTGTQEYEQAALFGSLSGFATLADSALRFRESASAAHARIVQLRILAIQVRQPPNANPLFEEYKSIRAQNFTLDYVNSVAEFVSPPKTEFDIVNVQDLPQYPSSAPERAARATTAGATETS